MRTDVGNPNYYHKVVDCQWACPAHTNVPEYIRLIAQGRFSDAYIVNRESNVFPGILGRTCDRPCEPACRRDPRRRQARRHLPAEARRRGSQGRHPRPHPDRPDGQERKEGGAHRRRSGVPDRGQRPDAARLPVHHLREGAAPGRPDAHQHPRLPPPRRSAGRRDWLHHQHGRRR